MHIVAAGGFSDIIQRELGTWQGLVRGAITLGAIAVIGIVFITKRALVPVIGAVVVSALVLWAVWNTDFLRQKTNEEINQNGLAPVSRVVDHPGATR